MMTKAAASGGRDGETSGVLMRRCCVLLLINFMRGLCCCSCSHGRCAVLLPCAVLLLLVASSARRAGGAGGPVVCPRARAARPLRTTAGLCPFGNRTVTRLLLHKSSTYNKNVLERDSYFLMTLVTALRASSRVLQRLYSTRMQHEHSWAFILIYLVI